MSTTPSGADALQSKPPGIDALQCVIEGLNDTACFVDEEGELTNDLRALHDWAFSRAAIANATGDDDAAPECTCAAKDMTFGRCCKVTHNTEGQRL